MMMQMNIFIHQNSNNETNEIMKLMLLFSAGVGRSGTLIAVDKLLSEAADMKTIDVLKCIEGLRLQRMYMVQTLVGYH